MDQNTAGRWNAAAGDYQKVFLGGQNEYNQAVFDFWEQAGMLRPGYRVLDIGCGVGKYGVSFAQRGCDVTLTDISPVMLSLAAENMAPYSTPWRTWCCDFSEATGQEDVFRPGFDFAISTMSGAIHDVDTVRKMSRMTRGWCFLSRFSDWREPLRRTLMDTVGMTPRSPFGDFQTDCAAVLRSVSDAGYTPQVRYVDYNWSDRRTPEELADYMVRRYLDDEAAREAMRGPLAEAARPYGDEEGLIDDAVQTKVMWVYWNTREE